MHVPRSQARQALGFRFRGFGDVVAGGGRPFGDKIAVLEGMGMGAASCCSTCSSKALGNFADPALGLFADDPITSVSNNTLSGGAAIFALGLLAFFMSRRKGA